MNNKKINFLFITGTPTSHILPIQSLSSILLNNYNCEIFCVTLDKHKDLIESFGMNFIEYPNCENKLSLSYNNMEKTRKLFENNDVEEAYDLFFETDVESMFDIDINCFGELVRIIKNKCIDLVFFDAVDKYAANAAYFLRIPTIGYLTHNLYSKEFFDTNPSRWYNLFLNGYVYDRYKYLSNNYFDNFFSKIDSLYLQNSLKYKYRIFPYHQFDPRTKHTIIFTFEDFQPKSSFNKTRTYSIIPPNIEERKKNEVISKEVVEFINSSDYIIYISSGSIVQQPLNYYVKLIETFTQNGISLIISAGKFKEFLRKYVQEHELESCVYIDEWIPQQYVLSRVNAFITAGGQNSILEALYHGIPMIVTPMTSEQRLNAALVEDMGVGFSLYNKPEERIKVSEMINMLNTKNAKDKLKTYSKKYKTTTFSHTSLINNINKELFQ